MTEETPESALSKKKTLRRNRALFWGMLVRELRLAKGISQRKLAAVSGVDRNTLRAVEGAKLDTSVYALESILIALDHELEAIDVNCLQRV